MVFGDQHHQSEQIRDWLNTDHLRQSISQVHSNQGLDETLKEELLELYSQIQKELESTARIKQDIKALDSMLQGSPRPFNPDIPASKPVSLPSPEALESWSLTRLEQELLSAENELVNLRNRSESLEAEQKKHEERRLQLPKLQAQLRETITRLQTESATPTSKLGLMEQAKQWLQEARFQKGKLELHLSEKEILSYDLKSDLFNSQIRSNQQNIQIQETQLQIIRKTLRSRRQEEAEEARTRALEAEENTASSHPLVRSIAAENTRLVEQLTSIRGKLPDEIIAEKERYQNTLSRVRNDYQNLLKRAESHAIDEILGFLFRKHQAELPSAEEFLRRRAQIKAELSLTQLEIFDFQEKLSNRKKESVQSIRSPSKDRHLQEVRTKTQKLLASQNRILEQLIRERNTFIYRLVDLDTVLTELIKEVSSFRSYIHENILWTRSHRPWNPMILLELNSLKNWLDSPDSWISCLNIAQRKVSDQPLTILLLLLIILLQLSLRRRGMKYLDNMGKTWEKKGLITLSPILKVLAWVLFLSLLWPTIYFFPAWVFDDPSRSTDFSMGLTRGFYLLSVYSFIFSFILMILRRTQLGQILLFWNGEGNKLLRRSLRVLLLIAYPCVLFYTLVSYAPTEGIKDPFQRIFFFIPMVALIIFFIQVFHPDRAFLRPLLCKKPLQSLFRYRWILFSSLVMLPVGLIIMSIFGYHYTAHQILTKFLQTIGCFLSIILLRSFFYRFIILLRNRLRYEKLQENASSEAEEPSPPTLEPDDIQKQVHQFLQGSATALLIVGFWMIWVELLPALQILERVKIFTVAKQVSRQVVDAAGIASLQLVDLDVTITLGDFLVSLFVLLLTFLISRNIPGMLEVFLLRRLKFAKGHSYAAVTLFQYLVIILGITVACSYLGITWDKVQWLAAALTVGLGFGLQEIFANFVAGIIILFEQPMRINDMVTVGDTTGRVTQIRIRATTITDFNNRELIVPNKDFITGNLVNWSLSNPVLRFDIPVGVAYKENPAQVERILVECAKAHEDVLSDPEPVAIFKELGDSSLNFELRFHTSNLDRFPLVKSEVLTSIFERLRLEEIEIPFPQRDLHIKDFSPLSTISQT